jgi:uncharacterized membrane protein YgcG
MRRPVRFLLVAVLGGLALLGFSAPAAAAPAMNAAQLSIVQAGTDDFTFDSWHSDFRLGRSPEGHSTLTTIETIVARFPETDQNHGIRRAIPTHYDGHPTGLRLVSVTDENGTPRASQTETSGDTGDEFLTVTSAADDFVHGAQTYVITYRQENVTLTPDNASDQEFYWEVNGTGWAQPFGDVSATLTVAPELVSSLTGQTACYQGGAASGAPCAGISTEAGGSRVTATAGSLAPYEGLTLVVGFQAGTFVPRDDSFTATPFPSIGLGGAILGLVGAAMAIYARATRWRNAQGRPTIIAEYLPPKGVNLLQAGNVTRTATKAMTAAFLSFAVRGNVRILEGDGKKHFLLELRHADGLDQTERAVLARLFPGLQPGTLRDLKAKDTALATGLQKELRASTSQVVTGGLREKKGGSLRRWLLLGAVASAVIAVAASVAALASEIGGGWPALTLVLGILFAALTVGLTASVRPLTTAGSELRDYLEGVKLYIGVAETDRLRVLQSPQGALRSPYRPDVASVLGDDGAADPIRPLQVLKLYERLLPFAVLFGQEKSWSAVLGDYYARSGSQPDWYSGSAPFNAAWFASGISTFASSTAASWSGTASSSSSSGMGGGGSVGGGGGGGGGGGV